MRVLTTNDPVMESDGDLIKLGDLGGEYTLPKASANTLGGIKVGDNLTIEEDGTLNADAQSYTLPAATTEVLGGIKVGDNLTIEEDGTLNADAQSYTLPPATAETLGGIKVGDNLTIEEDGTLNASGGGAYNVIEATRGYTTITEPISETIRLGNVLLLNVKFRTTASVDQYLDIIKFTSITDKAAGNYMINASAAGGTSDVPTYIPFIARKTDGYLCLAPTEAVSSGKTITISCVLMLNDSLS